MTGLVPSYTIIPLYPISPLISLVVGILLNQRQSYVSNMVEQSCMVSPLYPFTASTYASCMECLPTNWVILGAFIGGKSSSTTERFWVSSMYNLSPVFRGIADRVFYTWSRRKGSTDLICGEHGEVWSNNHNDS